MERENKYSNRRIQEHKYIWSEWGRTSNKIKSLNDIIFVIIIRKYSFIVSKLLSISKCENTVSTSMLSKIYVIKIAFLSSLRDMF